MKKTFFNHDSNARNDIRIIKLRAKIGMEGYGIFWSLLELLFTEENKLCINDYDSLAFGLQCDAKKLKQVIEDFDLFVIEDNCFYSRRLYDHIEEINNKSLKAKESIKKRWNNTNEIRTNNDSNTSISISNSKSKSKSKSDNLDKRASRFNKELSLLNGFDEEDKNNFRLYWTELNKSKTKMRFEMERTWDLKRRLQRWTSNGFNKTASKFPDWFDPETYKKLDTIKKKEYEDHLKSMGWISKYSPNAGMVWTKPKA